MWSKGKVLCFPLGIASRQPSLWLVWAWCCGSFGPVWGGTIWLSNHPLAAEPHAQVRPTSEPNILLPERCFPLWHEQEGVSNIISCLFCGKVIVLFDCVIFIFELWHARTSFVKHPAVILTISLYEGVLVKMEAFVFFFGCCSFPYSLGSPPHHPTNPALSPLITTETSETEITTTEIIKRRDVGPYGIRSEYCIRKIICPLGVPETPKGWWRLSCSCSLVKKPLKCMSTQRGFISFSQNTNNVLLCLPSQRPTPLRGKDCVPVPCVQRSKNPLSKPARWWSRHGCPRRSWTSGRSEPSQKGQRVTSESRWSVMICLPARLLNMTDLVFLFQGGERKGPGSRASKGDWLV